MGGGPGGGIVDLSFTSSDPLGDDALEAALSAAVASLTRPAPSPSPAPSDPLAEDLDLTAELEALARLLEEDEKRPAVSPRTQGGLFSDDDPSLAFPDLPAPGSAPSPREEELSAEIISLRARLAEVDANLYEMRADGEQVRRDLLRARQEIREYRDKADTSSAQVGVFQGRLAKASEEMDRLRRRGEREKEEASRYGCEKLLKDFLPVLDNLERALASAQEPGVALSAVVDGVSMTLGQWSATLHRHGVHPVPAEKGFPFDPAYHEAVDQAVDSSVEVGAVSQVHQRGYLLNDRLLRAARVTVALAPAADGKDEPISSTPMDSPREAVTDSAFEEDRREADPG